MVYRNTKLSLLCFCVWKVPICLVTKSKILKKMYLCKGDQATYFKNACIPCGSQSLAEVRALSIVYEFAKQTGNPGR